MARVRRPGAGALGRRQARAVWAAAAVLLVVAVTLAVAAAATLPAAPAARDPSSAQPVAAAALVAFELAMAYLLPRRIRRSAGPRLRGDALAAVQTIAASALALVAGLVCCAFFAVTREPLLLPLAVPCAAVLLHWRPSEARWVALGGSVPGWTEGHPMMRG